MTGSYFGSLDDARALAGLRILRTSYRPLSRLPEHAHEQSHFCFASRAGFHERARARDVTCFEGSLVWRAAGERHANAFGDSGSECITVQFDESWLARAGSARPPGWVHVRGGDVAWLGRRLSAELELTDSVSALAIDGIAAAIVARVCREREQGRTPPAWLDRIADRLRDEFASPPRLATLAHDAGVHRSHLARSFHRYMGCTMAEYVRRARVRWAAGQLSSRAGASISEIAHAAGFYDHAHFCREFKREVGMTPGQYRRCRV